MSANWVTPPGYRNFEDVLREYGRDRAETNLASGWWTAFAFDPYTGDLQQIPATTWCAEIGRKWLDEGSSVRFEKSETGISHYVIIVWIGRQPPRERDASRPEKNDNASATSANLKGLELAVAQATHEIWPEGCPVGLKVARRNDTIKTHLKHSGITVSDKTIERTFQKLATPPVK